MEYGSDFPIDLGKLEYTDDNIFEFLRGYTALYFDSGRSATRYLLKILVSQKVALPEYVCESIDECFPDSEKFYYSINERFEIIYLERIPWETIDIFYLMNYFGSIQPDQVLSYIAKMRDIYGFLIVEDTTHSILTKPATIGDYCVCSLRKWFPIPDGGVLYTKLSLDDREYAFLNEKQSDRIEGMVLKSLYLKGKVDTKDAFYKILIDTEQLLENQTDLYRLSVISEYILKCQNIHNIVDRRRNNYATMIRELGNLLPETIARRESDVPYIYVTRTEDRDAFRAFLAKNHVYCPVHWPLPTDWKSESARRLSLKLISIPIDQRYEKNEVTNTVRIIRGYCND